MMDGWGRSLRTREPKIYNDTVVDDEIEGKRSFSVEEKLMDEKFDYKLSDVVLELHGEEFNLKFIQEHGFNTPLYFKEKQGLGLKMPDPELFSIIDVKSYVGSRRTIEVFDCDTHQADTMSMHHWIRYYTGTDRERILNVTSLEFSHTGLDRLVDCPTLIRDHLDWVVQVWPEKLIAEQRDTTNVFENMKYPKVRKYVLMSVAGCYTDFHIDFGGTSVWYHVLKGAKVFWLIPPTERNLATYQEWVLSGRQQHTFFGDIVDDCYRIKLEPGSTFMIPSGWIHGVYTPEDSLVFGGNYLHSYNIPIQLAVANIEEETHVPKKLRFPFYQEIHWYLIKTYVEVLEKDLDERRLQEFEEEESDEGGVFKFVQDQIGDGKQSGEKTREKWQTIHLTVYELEGLKRLCQTFRKIPSDKKCIPEELCETSPMELLDRLEELLNYHEEDDQILACRGVDIFQQYKRFVNNENKHDIMKSPKIELKSTPLKERPPTNHNNTTENGISQNSKPENGISPNKRPKRKLTPTYKVMKTSPEKDEKSEKSEKRVRKPSEIIKKNSVMKTSRLVFRRVRCGDCDGCVQGNCDKCKYCLDSSRNGGPNRLKQSCMLRYCRNPQLPKFTACKICMEGREKNILMECSSCSTISHPACYKKTFPCKISNKVNNLWECFDCCSPKDPDAISYSVDKVTYRSKNGHQEETVVGKNGTENKVNKRKIHIQNKISQNNTARLKNLLSKKKLLNHVVLQKIKKGELNKKITSKDVKSEDDDHETSDDEPLVKLKPKVVEKKSRTEEISRHENIAAVTEPHIVKRVVRPAPFNGFERCVTEEDAEHILHSKLWKRVFSFLSKTDLLQCMLVCKAFNQWATSGEFWKHIDVSNKSITSQILKGIVRRGPISLNFSTTRLNGKQLEWLLNRLPYLENVDLTLNTAATVSAFLRVNCNSIKSLNISWCDAVYDRFMCQILSVQVANSDGLFETKCRFHSLEHLNVTGCDIGNEFLDCVLTTQKNLKTLVLNHCPNVSKAGFTLLLENRHACKNICKLYVGQCEGLTDIDKNILKSSLNHITILF